MPASKKPKVEKTCRHCKGTFLSNNAKQVSCSTKCNTYYSRILNPEKNRGKAKAYYQSVRDGRRTKDKLGRVLNPDKYKDRKLRERYGINIEEYRKMITQQQGKCAICNSEQKLHVDHSHDTGKVRGLLCNGCNRGLGYFSENPLALASAISYLQGRK